MLKALKSFTRLPTKTEHFFVVLVIMFVDFHFGIH